MKNLKVVELASVLAGPSVGQFFAELGAEVIKVENTKTRGDVTRTWKIAGEMDSDLSAYFCSVNWGKKSIALDLSSHGGNEIVKKLISKADIVIASYKPGDAEKLGVSYQQLKNTNPKLIYAQITGYGSHNNKVGYDAVIQAEAGFMDLNGEKNGQATKMPVALIDILAGHQLKEAILLSLLNRVQTGKGDFVEVSLIQTAVASLANQASNWLVANKLPVRQGSAHPNIAPYGEAFETSDDKNILFAVGNDKQFTDLGLVLELKEELETEKFSTNQKRVENRIELNRIIAAKVKQLKAKDLIEKINSYKIPAGLIQNVKEAFEMKEAKELVIENDGVMGVQCFIASTQSNQNKIKLTRPPHFGEHTKEILKMLSDLS